MAGMTEMQELKKVTELRSRLRAVSEAGVGGAVRAELGGRGPAGLLSEHQAEDPRGGLPFFSVLQLAEALSRCSHSITESQTSLSNLRSELLKNRDQVHADRRSVGFSFLVGWAQGRTAWKVQ